MPNNILKIYYLSTEYNEFWDYFLDKYDGCLEETGYRSSSIHKDCESLSKCMRKDGYNVEYGEDDDRIDNRNEPFILIDEKVYLNFILKIS
jgi:hypothetical protein